MDEAPYQFLVTVAEFHSQADFLLARTRLESAGIECLAQEQDLLRFGWQSHTGGIRLQVWDYDTEEAAGILQLQAPAVSNQPVVVAAVGPLGERLMRNFVLGAVVAIVVAVLVGLGYALLGFIHTNADTTPPESEHRLALAALDASMERHAPRLNNPVPPTEANLIEGMKMYTMNCALCHGGLDKKPSTLAKSFYPPAPQLILEPLDDPEWHTFYAVRTGVRYTGMPAWSKTLSEEDIWRITGFLSRIQKLPPGAKDYWQKAFGVSPESFSGSHKD